MKKIISAAILALVVSGCAQQTFVMSDANNQIKEETSQNFFVYGIGQEKEIDAASVCGGADKVAKVETQDTFVNGLLRVVTFGIYTPRDARVFCKS